MTFRESDRSIVPLSPTGLLKKGQSGNEKPSNIVVGKAVGISCDPGQAPPVLSDGTTVSCVYLLLPLAAGSQHDSNT